MLMAALGGWCWSARSTWPACSSAWSCCRCRSTAWWRTAFFNKRSLEAGIKYMVLSAAGSAFLLFGMALLYAEWQPELRRYRSGPGRHHAKLLASWAWA
jgi:hypothetical protein